MTKYTYFREVYSGRVFFDKRTEKRILAMRARARNSTGLSLLSMALAFIGIVTLGTVWGGFVIMQLWGWFIVPTFENAPSLNLVEAIGLDLVVTMLTLKRTAASNEDEPFIDGVIVSFFYGLIMGAILLFIGFAVSAFM